MTNEEIKAKQQELENKNSIKAKRRTDNAFCYFLGQANADSVEYQFFNEPELSNWLSKFWYRARTSTFMQ